MAIDLSKLIKKIPTATNPAQVTSVPTPTVASTQSVIVTPITEVGKEKNQPAQEVVTAIQQDVVTNPVAKVKVEEPDPSTESGAITFQLRQKIGELQDALLSRHPSMPTLLQQIHRTIRQYPEQVTILAPEEVNKIVEGLMIQTQVSFATEKSSKTAATKSVTKKIQSLGVDAF